MKRFIYALLVFAPLCSFSQQDWMRYSSISPDGKQIAFSYQGDLFLDPRTGGIAKQLTTHIAHDFMPVWSNDGTKLAFSSNRYGNFDVFIIDAVGGTPKRLTYHSSSDYVYAFSPDDASVIYGSSRLDDPASVQFPYAGLGEVYTVSTQEGREKQWLTVCAEFIAYRKDGKKVLFQDRKGYEDPWRKHHVSSVTRDIIEYDVEQKTYRKLTDWRGEDRNPIYGEGNTFYFLSEKGGTFNVWQGSTEGNTYEKQLTDFKTHPVRFLSRANNGILCFGYHGGIYTLENGKIEKVAIQIHKDEVKNEEKILPIGGNASEFQISSDGKEVVFISRGNVFVASIEFGTTKQLTFTAEQERNVSFSPDGQSILYAGERNESWNIYEITKVNKGERYFYNSSLTKESVLIETEEETFDPKYGPDGKEIAFLSDRTTLKVYNIATKKIRTVLDGHYNYSYSDGDQYFTWSPDAKFILVQFFEFGRWSTDVGLVDVTALNKTLNLTQSGYGNSNPKFAMDGQMIYYATDKYGYRSHGSWGAESDVEAVFLNQDAYSKFTMNEQDYKIWKEEQEKVKEKSEDKAKKEKSGTKEEQTIKPIVIEELGLQNRKVKLTIHSSFLSDFIINNEGPALYYLTQMDKDFDIWVTKFKEQETKLLHKAGSHGSNLFFDKDEKNLYFTAPSGMQKMEIATSKVESIKVNAEMLLNEDEERAYMFEHAWRQAREKFYVEDLHGVDWEGMKKAYAPFLASINNGYDFAEMLSELLGELNASHTGAFYRPSFPYSDQTGTFGCYFDQQYNGDGLRIVEIMEHSPLLLHSKKIKNGVIIQKIDGTPILKDKNHYALLNRKIGKKVWLTFYDPSNKTTWEEFITPISVGQEQELAYHRYMARCEKMVDSLSNGTLGYVHIKGMNSASFRELYDQALGKLNTKKALIVDTRFNGGGWLHDDLATFLSGKLYMSFEPRGQKNMGGEPISKWQKPSAVLMSEGNYSDAHLFPYTYKALGIGPLIGMPVPGTGTAVWWETMIDGNTIFGIPQVGMRSVKDGYLVENHELNPDIEVENQYEKFTKGIDQQLMKAVSILMK